MWAAVSPGAAITRLTPPAEGWPDAFLHLEDIPLVAVGGAPWRRVRLPPCGSASDALVLHGASTGLGDHHVRLQPEDRTVLRSSSPLRVDLIGPIVTIVRGVAAAVGSQRRTA
ncbi:MAG: hypothetical protein U0531_22555 [Dehalococcoidia bacterium]